MRTPRSIRTNTLFPDTTLFRSDPSTKFLVVDVRIDDELGKVGLMVPKPHDQKRRAGKLTLEPSDKILVVTLGHRLPAQVLVDFGHCVAGIAPADRKRTRLNSSP